MRTVIRVVNDSNTRTLSIDHNKDRVDVYVDNLFVSMSYSAWIAIMNASEELCNANYLEPEIACDK